MWYSPYSLDAVFGVIMSSPETNAIPSCSSASLGIAVLLPAPTPDETLTYGIDHSRAQGKCVDIGEGSVDRIIRNISQLIYTAHMEAASAPIRNFDSYILA